MNLNDREWRKAEIDEVLPYRSYVVRTEDGATYRRNSRHVRFSDEPPILRDDADSATNTPSIESPARGLMADANLTRGNAADAETQAIRPANNPLTSHSGRVIRKPVRFRED